MASLATLALRFVVVRARKDSTTRVAVQVGGDGLGFALTLVRTFLAEVLAGDRITAGVEGPDGVLRVCLDVRAVTRRRVLTWEVNG